MNDSIHCLFENESDGCNATRSSEHIIPRSLGGSLESEDLICQACNNYFSGSVDLALTQLFEHPRIILGPLMPGGLGKKTIRAHATVDPVELEVGGGGSVRLAKSIHRVRDDEGEVQALLADETMVGHDQLRRIGGSIAGRDLANAEVQRVRVSDELARAETRHRVEIGDEVIRGVALIAVELMRYAELHRGLNLDVSGAWMSALRSYIRTGRRNAIVGSHRIHFVHRQALIDDLLAPCPFSHRIVISINREQQCMDMLVSLFGTMPWWFQHPLSPRPDNLESQTIRYHRQVVTRDPDTFEVVQGAAFRKSDFGIYSTFSRASRASYEFAYSKYFGSLRTIMRSATTYADLHIDGPLSDSLDLEAEFHGSDYTAAVVALISARYAESRKLERIQRAAEEFLSEQVESDPSSASECLPLFRGTLVHIVGLFGLPPLIRVLDSGSEVTYES